MHTRHAFNDVCIAFMTIAQYITSCRDDASNHEFNDTRIAFVKSIDAFIARVRKCNEQYECNAYIDRDAMNEILQSNAIYLIETIHKFYMFVDDIDDSCVDDIVRAMFQHMSVQLFG